MLKQLKLPLVGSAQLVALKSDERLCLVVGDRCSRLVQIWMTI